MKKLLPLIILLLVCRIASAQIITTVAGGGTVIGGDGGMATDCSLQTPVGVVVDGAGNFYICERDAHRVRKVTVDGAITTFAGTGVAGFSGDGGPATSAMLNSPYCIALDAAGVVYIGDVSTVRKVNTAGIISTVAGNGVVGFGGDSGPATLAQLNGPSGLTIDHSGNIIIADKKNHRLRRVGADGIITTIAGTGSVSYNGENIPATAANLYEPSGVTIDATGNLFVLEYINPRVRKIATSGIITTIAGNGTTGYSGDGGLATLAAFDRPIGIVCDKYGDVYIGATFNNRIRKVSTSGLITSVAGNGLPGSAGDGGAATAAQLYAPTGVAIDPAGNLFVCSFYADKVRKISNMVGVGDGVLRNGSLGEMEIYPNPSSGRFSVSVAAPQTAIIDITVSDLLGRRVLSKTAETNTEVPLDLHVPNGVYVVTVVASGAQLTEKMYLIK
jgi:trimeric autotransporter adhesin